jgi:hypothetical protein
MMPRREEIDLSVGGTEMKNVVNRRYQALSLEDLASQVAKQMPDDGLHFEGEEGRNKLRVFARNLGAWMLHELRWSMTRAAEKAFCEVAALVEDPDYYNTVKERRRRQKVQQETWRREQEDRAAREKVQMLSPEEQDKKRGQLERERAFHLRSIAHIDDQLLQLGSDVSWLNETKM